MIGIGSAVDGEGQPKSQTWKGADYTVISWRANLRPERNKKLSGPCKN